MSLLGHLRAILSELVLEFRSDSTYGEVIWKAANKGIDKFEQNLFQ